MEIRPSQRVENIKEYYFSTKLKEVAAMKAAGHDVISLGIGGPDRPPHKDVIDTMAAAFQAPDNISHT